MTPKKIELISWNLENLFDPDSGGPRSDFTHHEGWTTERYSSKIDRLSKVINTIIETSDSNTAFIFGFCEVENENVARKLLEKLDPKFVLATSPEMDSLGYLDNILIYDSSLLELTACQYYNFFQRFPRGEVVKGEFLLKGVQEKLTVFNTHLKARPKNKYFTSMYRQALCDNLQALIWKMHGGDQLLKEHQKIKDEIKGLPTSFLSYPNIVLMGDFNDEPFSQSLMEYLLATYDKNYVVNNDNIEITPLYNCSWEALTDSRPGTNYYSKSTHSKWSMLDQIIISPSLLKNPNSLNYQQNSFRIINSLTSDSSGIPKRIREWGEDGESIWQEGYSDHFPVGITITRN